jgi:hypothetical protein
MTMMTTMMTMTEAIRAGDGQEEGLRRCEIVEATSRSHHQAILIDMCLALGMSGARVAEGGVERMVDGLGKGEKAVAEVDPIGARTE